VDSKRYPHEAVRVCTKLPSMQHLSSINQCLGFSRFPDISQNLSSRISSEKVRVAQVYCHCPVIASIMTCEARMQPCSWFKKVVINHVKKTPDNARTKYVKRNNKARSRNHRFRGIAISITYSECVSVALVIQHAKCMHRIILSSVFSMATRNFSTLPHKQSCLT
jgi:hypothetical protein